MTENKDQNIKGKMNEATKEKWEWRRNVDKLKTHKRKMATGGKDKKSLTKEEKRTIVKSDDALMRAATTELQQNRQVYQLISSSIPPISPYPAQKWRQSHISRNPGGRRAHEELIHILLIVKFAFEVLK